MRRYLDVGGLVLGRPARHNQTLERIRGRELQRESEGGRQRGFFVSFGYTKDAEQECAAFHKRTGRMIKLLTMQELLDEEHVQKSDCPAESIPRGEQRACGSV
jgi:hypothetical protein